MLKKKLCQKCHLMQYGIKRGWTQYTERIWEEGLIFCPREYIEKGERDIRSITDRPPSKCPYVLENTI